jgi:hypothetical protein
MDNEEPIVWHAPILVEYWAEFYDQMRQLDSVPDFEVINIVNVEMKKESMALLIDIIRSGKATNSSMKVIFNNPNICGEGIVCLSKLVDVSYNLQEFRLHYNQIDSIESAHCLSRSLKSQPGITHLWLSHCDLGSSPEILMVILQSDISNIRLNNNNIDSLGAITIAEYLESDPPMQSINLDDNQLNDDDAIRISQALKRNTNLKIINLYTNNFTSIGVKALLSCAFDSSSLEAISKSNHTLNQLTIFSCQETYISSSHRYQGCIDRLLRLDRIQKIVIALEDKDSQLQYLANIPIYLIPEVLAFPLRIVNHPLHIPRGWAVDDRCQISNLNIVYSTMRWWNMPMLYSYHNCAKSDTKRKRVD